MELQRAAVAAAASAQKWLITCSSKTAVKQQYNSSKAAVKQQ
jgi:hypothetical protein